MKPLTSEQIQELSQTRNGFYSWDYVARLASRVVELEAERRWIPTSERLPEYDTDVLAIIRGGDYIIAYYYADNWWVSRFDSMVTVTHWQPLPKPPVSEGENDSGTN